MPDRLTGRCLCGAIAFEIDSLLEGPVACHCRECQRQSGSAFWVAVTASQDAVRILGDRLGWVQATREAERGYCRDCGGYLFWRPLGGDTLDIAFGALDGIEGMTLVAHIFTAEARLPLPDDKIPRFAHGRKGID